MIEKLTKFQEDELLVYRDKWLGVGLSTKQIDLKQAIDIKNSVYIKLLNKKYVPAILMDSPLTSWLATMYLANLFKVESQVGSQVESQVGSQVWIQVRSQVESQVGRQVWSQVESQVGRQVWSQVESQVGRQVWSQVRRQVGRQVRSQVGSQVWSQVESQVRRQVWSQVGSQVERQVESQVRSQVGLFVWPYLGGQFDSSYFSFYEFMFDVLKIPFPSKLVRKEKWDSYLQITKSGIIYPTDDFCVISNKPKEINMRNGVLHAEGKPSVLYNDGFSVWSLNGVRVSKEIAETPAGELDPKMVLTEKNAEVRREIVRKIGVERVCKKLGAKVMDRKGEIYELLNLDLGENRIRPYLKMVNPSTGTYHIEGVSPECNSVEMALNWRNKSTEKPFILT
jgi:hypothetical protein